MSALETFLLAVLAEITGAAIIFVTATWRSKAVRRALTAVASTFLNIDVEYVFPTGLEAECSIKEALSRAQSVRIFSGRGNSFQRDLFASLIMKSDGKRPSVQVLLPDPCPTPQGSNWVAHRESEVATFDRSFGRGTLPKQIDNVLFFLQPHLDAGHFEVRKYDTPHICRFILTDEHLFLTPYSRLMHGRHSRVYQFGRGDLYDMFERFFDMIWETSDNRALQPPPSK
jgi:hypothetical protein